MHHHNNEKQTYLVLTDAGTGTKMLVNAKTLQRVKNTSTGVQFYQESQGELVAVTETFDKIVLALKDSGHHVKEVV